MNLYSTIGSHRGASNETLRKDYLKKVKTVHPDTGGTSEEFARVQQAWRILGNPVSRAMYDRTLGPSSEDIEDVGRRIFSEALVECLDVNLPEDLEELQKLPDFSGVEDKLEDIDVVLHKTKTVLQGRLAPVEKEYNQLISTACLIRKVNKSFPGMPEVGAYLTRIESRLEKVEKRLNVLYVALSYVPPIPQSET